MQHCGPRRANGWLFRSCSTVWGADGIYPGRCSVRPEESIKSPPTSAPAPSIFHMSSSLDHPEMRRYTARAAWHSASSGPFSQPTMESEMARKVVLIRHSDKPADDRVAFFFQQTDQLIEAHGRVHGDVFGPVDDSVAGIVIHGPFVVTDAYPFLSDEAGGSRRTCAATSLCSASARAPRPSRTCSAPAWARYPVTRTSSATILTTEPRRRATPYLKSCTSLRRTSMNSTCRSAPSCSRLATPFRIRRFATASTPVHSSSIRTSPSPGFDAGRTPTGRGYGNPGVQTRGEQDALARCHDNREHRWFMGFLAHLFGKIGSDADVLPRPIAAHG